MHAYGHNMKDDRRMLLKLELAASIPHTLMKNIDKWLTDAVLPQVTQLVYDCLVRGCCFVVCVPGRLSYKSIFFSYHSQDLP